jgi:hypothetical protein
MGLGGATQGSQGRAVHALFNLQRIAATVRCQASAPIYCPNILWNSDWESADLEHLLPVKWNSSLGVYHPLLPVTNIPNTLFLIQCFHDCLSQKSDEALCKPWCKPLDAAKDSDAAKDVDAASVLLLLSGATSSAPPANKRDKPGPRPPNISRADILTAPSYGTGQLRPVSCASLCWLLATDLSGL